MAVKLRIHLANANVIEEVIDTDDSAEAIQAALGSAISEGRPHWHAIESTLLFTQVVQAIEVLEI